MDTTNSLDQILEIRTLFKPSKDEVISYVCTAQKYIVFLTT